MFCGVFVISFKRVNGGTPVDPEMVLLVDSSNEGFGGKSSRDAVGLVCAGARAAVCRIAA